MAITAFSRYGGAASAAAADAWRPHPDWPDIRSMAEQETDPNFRGIFLFADMMFRHDNAIENWYMGSPTAVLKTFNGDTVNYGSKIPWNSAQDIPCAEGYRTRWIKLYDPSPNMAFTDMGRYPLLWCVLKNTNLNSFYANYNNTIRCIELINTAAADSIIGNSLFRDLLYLEKFEFPSGITKIGDAMFPNCRSLKYIKIPQGIATIGNGAFSNSGIRELVMPDSVTTVGDYFASDCFELRRLKISANASVYTTASPFAKISCASCMEIPQGYVMPANNMSADTCMTISLSWFVNFCSRLGTAPSNRTITFGTEFMNSIKSYPEGVAAISTANAKRYYFA